MLLKELPAYISSKKYFTGDLSKGYASKIAKQGELSDCNNICVYVMCREQICHHSHF